MIRATVAGTILDEQSRTPVVLLRLASLDKYLPIWIGPSEAASISLALQKERFERPLTHDLLVTVVDGLEAKISRVVITGQRDNTYYAKMYLTRENQVIGIDARPSDSIAVALRAEAPIFVAEEVVEAVAASLLTLDEEATRTLLERLRGQQRAADAGGKEDQATVAEPETDPSTDNDPLLPPPDEDGEGKDS
jgi:bifunctional DNase/RNase